MAATLERQVTEHRCAKDEFPLLFERFHSLWEALEMKAQSPEKFTDVSDVEGE